MKEQINLPARGKLAPHLSWSCLRSLPSYELIYFILTYATHIFARDINRNRSFLKIEINVSIVLNGQDWMGLWHPVIHYAMLRTNKWSRISLWHGAIGHRFSYRSRRGQWQRGTFGWTTSKTRVTTLELRYSLASGTHPGLKKGHISNKCDLDPFNRLATSSHSEPRLLWLPTKLEESKILTWGI
jgi:hypothetical protein